MPKRETDFSPAGMTGNADDRFQAAKHALAERDLAAVAPDDVAGDREPKAGAFLVLVARFVEAVEGPEDLLPLFGRDAGAIIFDRDCEPAP